MAKTQATSLGLRSLAMSLAGDEFHLESEEDLLFSPTRSIPLLAPYPIPRSDARRRRWRSKGALLRSTTRPRPPFVASVCADQISYHPPILRARVFILRDRLLALGGPCDIQSKVASTATADRSPEKTIDPSREKCRGPLDFDISCPNRADGPCESEKDDPLACQSRVKRDSSPLRRGRVP